MANGNYNWLNYADGVANTFAGDGANRVFTPTFPGFVVGDFRAYVKPAGDVEAEVSIESGRQVAVAVPGFFELTLEDTPPAGSEVRFSLEGLPLSRQTDNLAATISGAAINENADRAAAMAAVAALHYHGAGGAFSGDAHDNVARARAQQALDGVLLITDEADRSKIRASALPEIQIADITGLQAALNAAAASGGGGGATSFRALTDTPAAYGLPHQIPAMNAAGTALVWIDQPQGNAGFISAAHDRLEIDAALDATGIHGECRFTRP